MSALDNIMVGRNLKMKRGFAWQALRLGPALREEVEHRAFVEKIIDFLEIQAIARRPRAACLTACRNASSSPARSPWSPSCCFSTSRWPA